MHKDEATFAFMSILNAISYWLHERNYTINTFPARNLQMYAHNNNLEPYSKCYG